MNLMLVWWLKPEIALLFTSFAIIHYLTIFAYGFFDLECGSAIFSYAYFGIHLIILTIAIFASFKWTVITVTITTLAFFLAPDCTGNNIFLSKPNVDNQLPLLFNTIIFAAFVVVDFLLPIKIWIKLVILVGALIIHPVIDWLEGECVIIPDVTYDVVKKIKEDKDSKKNH